MKKTFIILIISISILTGCSKEIKKEEVSKIIEDNNMLSYTIDGEKTDIKPTKEAGYIVNKIICNNGSDLMWDNNNWEVELTKVSGKDSCKVDFTKDVSTPGYRVTVTSNIPSALDSLSKATTLNGTVKIYSKSKIESITGCNGTIDENKVTISNINSIQNCIITVEDKSLAGVIKTKYPSKGARSEETFLSTFEETGIFETSDNQGISYYFTGNPNNWVLFANNLWRIIRINGNGSIRLEFFGDGSNNLHIGKVSYNSSYSNPAYVGWKFNTSGATGRGNNPSDAYSYISEWYNGSKKGEYNGLTENDRKYIDTEAIYCNDRGIATGDSYSTWDLFHYKPYERLETNKQPTLICANNEDMFRDGFGLLTADEVVFSGKGQNYGCTDKNGKPTNVSLWTMTPYLFGQYDSNDRNARIYTTGGCGISNTYVTRINAGYVRPVISLKKEVQVTGGDGSGDNPYTVILP